MEDRKSYLKNYYKNNKDRIKKYKSEKYKNDQEYRQRALLRSRLQSLEKNNDKEYELPSNLYYLHQVASVINRADSSIQTWVKRGCIPVANHFDNKGIEVYTTDQILYLEFLINKIDSNDISIKYERVRELLEQVWDKPFSVDTFSSIIKQESKNG